MPSQSSHSLCKQSMTERPCRGGQHSNERFIHGLGRRAAQEAWPIQAIHTAVLFACWVGVPSHMVLPDRCKSSGTHSGGSSWTSNCCLAGLAFCKRAAQHRRTSWLAGGLRGGALSTALLLSAMGAVLGSLVANGSVFLLAAVAMALNYVPWGRLPLSRHHPALSCAMTTGGFAAALWLRHQAIDVMFLPFAAWAFWVAACIGLMQVAEQSRRSKRSMAAQSTAVKGGIHPAIFDT